jgi:hypothetical protein
MRYLKFIVAFTFLIIQYRTIETAAGISNGLGFWFLPVSLALVFTPTGYFVYKAVKDK